MAININHVTNTISADSGSIGLGAISFKNRVINGQFSISQRGTAAQTVTAGNAIPTQTASAASGYYIDRWFTYSVGGNVTIAPATVGTVPVGQITGGASVTQVGVGQRIEGANLVDIAGNKATLSFAMSNSLLTTASVYVYYANTADTFGTIAIPTKTLIDSGVGFAVSSTLSSYRLILTMPTNVTSGVEILFVVDGQTSGTWNITNVQLERGTVNTAYDYRPIGYEMMLCQRYLEVIAIQAFRTSGFNTTAAATTNYGNVPMLVAKRITPFVLGTITYSNSSAITYTPSTNAISWTITNTSASVMWAAFNSTILTINAEII